MYIFISIMAAVIKEMMENSIKTGNISRCMTLSAFKQQFYVPGSQ